MIRKFAKTDRILLGIQLATFAMFFIVEIIVGKWTYVTLGLKVLGILLFPILIALYRKALKKKSINILITIIEIYLVAIMIVK